MLEAPEFEEGFAAGFRGGHAGAEIVIDVKLEVGAKLIVEVAVELVLLEEIAEAEECGAEIHGWTSVFGFEFRRRETPRTEGFRASPTPFELTGGGSLRESVELRWVMGRFGREWLKRGSELRGGASRRLVAGCGFHRRRFFLSG